MFIRFPGLLDFPKSIRMKKTVFRSDCRKTLKKIALLGFNCSVS